MTDVHEIRQSLRDYAREEAATIITRRHGDEVFEMREAQRGELAGTVFEALQDVLTYLEEEQAENSRPLLSHEYGYGDRPVDQDVRSTRLARASLCIELRRVIERRFS
jgi:hypothetical protein